MDENKVERAIEKIKIRLSEKEGTKLSENEIQFINHFMFKFEMWWGERSNLEMLKDLGDFNIGLYAIKEIDDIEPDLAEDLCVMEGFIDNNLRRQAS